MRKKVNKLLTILLALTIFLNSFNVVYASEENKTSLGSDASVEMEVEGTDSVGLHRKFKHKKMSDFKMKVIVLCL